MYNLMWHLSLLTTNAHEQRCQRHMEDVYGKIMCTRRKLAISKVWHTWRSYAGHQRHLEDAGRTIVMRWLNQVLHFGFCFR